VTNKDINEVSFAMSNHDYPGLFRAADRTSTSAQKMYFTLQCIYLVSLIIGGILGAFTFLFPEGVSIYLYTSMAIVLAAGLLVLWIGRARQDDKIWFDCRAVAESVKTATWRFMIGAPPFENDDAIDQRFISELQEIREARPDCQKHLAGALDANAPAISDFMRQMRTHTFEERKQFYIKQRLCDQKSWYSRKARINARIGDRWFWSIVVLQVFAVVTAIAQIPIRGFYVNIVTIITTCAAVAVAWNQMKRHDELKRTYTLAAQELSELEAIAHGVTTNEDFLQLVEQVEEAISREHTMWCARRDVLLRRDAYPSSKGR